MFTIAQCNSTSSFTSISIFSWKIISFRSHFLLGNGVTSHNDKKMSKRPVYVQVARVKEIQVKYFFQCTRKNSNALYKTFFVNSRFTLSIKISVMSLSSEYIEQQDLEYGTDGTFWSDEIMMYQFQLVISYQAAPRALFYYHQTGQICPVVHWEFYNDFRFQSQAKRISWIELGTFQLGV